VPSNSSVPVASPERGHRQFFAIVDLLHNPLAFQALPSDPCDDRAERGTKETGPREGSKTAQVVAMLQRKNGATLPEIMKTMGWQKHTVRGFMAGAMKKAGYSVESFKSDKGERTYRINQ
jgi:hypothetical protein